MPPTTSTTARGRATTTSAADDRRAAAAAPTTSASTTVPTVPPTGARFITDGPGQSYSNFAAATTIVQGKASSSVAIPSGVWAATVGLSTASTSAGASAAAVADGSAPTGTPAKKFPIIPVAAGAGGGALLLVVLGIVICCCVKKRRARQRDSFKMRTQNLRNSLISPPVAANDKFGSYEPKSDPYAYAQDYRSAPTPVQHYEPARQQYQAIDGASTYSRDTYAPNGGGGDRFQMPSRFAAQSAQDRGYGSRQPMSYYRG